MDLITLAVAKKYSGGGGSSGGSGGDDVFIIKFINSPANPNDWHCDKTYNEILDAVNNDKVILIYTQQQYEKDGVVTYKSPSGIYAPHNIYQPSTIDGHIEIITSANYINTVTNTITFNHFTFSISTDNAVTRTSTSASVSFTQ